jgi:hypothetical protein
MTNQTFTQNELKTLLDYNQDTGLFTWKLYRGGTAKVGDTAGKVEANGYHRIKVNGKLYLAHRLAWFYEYGIWPDKDLDHINRIKTDNRLVNLRVATRSENIQNTGLRKNNSSSVIGVSWNNQKSMWRAYITKDYKQIHLGLFKSKDEAVVARQKAEQTFFSSEFYFKAA